jgi:hypothetical protein
MNRREPPPIAVWMLEHLTSGERDEALAGDLLEAFQAGRSNAWYWRQVFDACVVSWFESLRARASMLVFALLWTIMAPAWNVLCQKLESGKFSTTFVNELISKLGGPVWLFAALPSWIILHAVFLWGGLLIFSLLHTRTAGSLYRDKYKRAFLISPLIFTPVYGALYLFVTLNWYGYFENFPLLSSPWGQIADFRVLADAIRLPYLFALVCALWRAIPVSSRVSESMNSDRSANGADMRAPTSPADSFVVKRFFVLMIGAGLMNALIAGFLICRLPESHSPSLMLLCTKAAFYVLAGVLAGVGGTYLYWKNPASPFSASEPLPFGLFALVCTRGWVWVPALVILFEQLSPATAFVAMIGTFALTSGVRRVSSPVFASAGRAIVASRQSQLSLFTESLCPAPGEPYGHLIAICLYAGGAAFFLRSYPTAAALLALAASVFAWRQTEPQIPRSSWNQEYRRAALNLTKFVIPAVLVTAWALLDGVAHRNHLEAVSAAVYSDAKDSATKEARGLLKSKEAALGGGGYESVILWPYPKKDPIVPPVVVENNLLARGTKETLIVRFNGPYWYLQPPNKVPGRMAHLAKGTPLAFDIQSSNFMPLVMDAHQYLSSSIHVARCREITVELANYDNKIGAISLGVLLTDGTYAKKPTLYLGQQPIMSTESGHFSTKSAPVFETLRFSVPMNTGIQKFNEITVLILPDIEHRFEAPKIAIERFELFPR